MGYRLVQDRLRGSLRRFWTAPQVESACAKPLWDMPDGSPPAFREFSGTWRRKQFFGCRQDTLGDEPATCNLCPTRCRRCSRLLCMTLGSVGNARVSPFGCSLDCKSTLSQPTPLPVYIAPRRSPPCPSGSVAARRALLVRCVRLLCCVLGQLANTLVVTATRHGLRGGRCSPFRAPVRKRASVIRTPVKRPSKSRAIPRPRADKDSIRKVARTIESVGRASIRIVRVISVKQAGRARMPALQKLPSSARPGRVEDPSLDKIQGRLAPPLHQLATRNQQLTTNNCSYVPSFQLARYSSCSGVRRSILMPMDSSFSLATRLSRSTGTM